VALKNHYADKTNWRKMLTNMVEHVDLIAEEQNSAAVMKCKNISFK
jgi:hypothetical protein